jgi:protein dithiol oxidoreductase (disulfide-forming)
MKRRELSTGLLACSLGMAGLATRPAQAQGGPVEGTHYVRLGQPVPVGGSKIEVVEFFWYGCPHCNDFEPTLEPWSKKVPADVAFRRVHVAFREVPFAAHQRIFYTLEAMGQLEAMHRKVFYAIHVERARLDKPAEISAFMVKNGLDGAKFLDTYNSFSVQTRTRQANQLTEAYRIDGVPAIGIQGRFYTAPGRAGSPERALAVTEFLIDKIRRAA